MSRRLTKAQKEVLDASILRFLRRGRASIWSVNAHAELHSPEEVLASLRRLKKAKLVKTVRDWTGWFWVATTPKESDAK